MSHSVCGTELTLDGACASCRRIVDPSEMTSELDPRFAAEREHRLGRA
jgi:hypothetical protein